MTTEAIKPKESSLRTIEQNYGSLLRWATVVIVTGMWAVLWLYADHRYPSHEELKAKEIEFRAEMTEKADHIVKIISSKEADMFKLRASDIAAITEKIDDLDETVKNRAHVVDASVSERAHVVDANISENRKEIYSIGKNVERVLAQNELIIKTLNKLKP